MGETLGGKTGWKIWTFDGLFSRETLEDMQQDEW
jgi:hypothetical protein